MKKERGDHCTNCPMYYCTCDYWGEYDEGCEINLDAWFNGKYHKLICFMPVFIKKIYQKYLRWREERYWEKYIKEEEALMEAENEKACDDTLASLKNNTREECKDGE